MTEHVLQVMHGPTGLEQARVAFVPEVVEVQVNLPIRRPDSGLSLVLPLAPDLSFQPRALVATVRRRG